MNIKFSPVKMFAWVSILLMSFIMFFDACTADIPKGKSVYKIKIIEKNSYSKGKMSFQQLDSRYEVGDTIIYDGYLQVVIKKMDP